jgi:hypothetical protein
MKAMLYTGSVFHAEIDVPDARAFPSLLVVYQVGTSNGEMPPSLIPHYFVQRDPQAADVNERRVYVKTHPVHVVLPPEPKPNEEPPTLTPERLKAEAKGSEGAINPDGGGRSA